MKKVVLLFLFFLIAIPLVGVMYQTSNLSGNQARSIPTMSKVSWNTSPQNFTKNDTVVFTKLLEDKLSQENLDNRIFQVISAQKDSNFAILGLAQLDKSGNIIATEPWTILAWKKGEMWQLYLPQDKDFCQVVKVLPVGVGGDSMRAYAVGCK